MHDVFGCGHVVILVSFGGCFSCQGCFLPTIRCVSQDRVIHFLIKASHVCQWQQLLPSPELHQVPLINEKYVSLLLKLPCNFLVFCLRMRGFLHFCSFYVLLCVRVHMSV